ncbi:Leucine-rich repeat and coiled-coil domain-containing protein 1 [Phytophthora citrophthora]|uniref:Leucine-rich repeat and coiled-coil domain-containing protein 1 n=1 Tax=Phytophthora citrophthora TaxID=4793 RepID=A0AAD9GWQ1_9STRA|nr:Leucine-rich repeat and coiled-coil domain-containing protein 1 [Phytophthora citrophthora]
MTSPPPPPPPAPDDDLDLSLYPIVLSHVNAGVEFIDDLANDDERDELVEQMNLHGNAIQSLDGLEAFTGLVELCLSSNYINEITSHALQPLVHLRVLDLSANSIGSMVGFPQLPKLEELLMAHNCLSGLDDLTRPIKFPKLRYLDLRGNEIAEFNDLKLLQRFKRLSHLRLQAANGDQANPICDLDGYHHATIQMLPRLELLDEEEVEFLKEMGSLHMPKYRSLVRRIVENKGGDRQLKSPQDGKGTATTPERRRALDQNDKRTKFSPPRFKTDREEQETEKLAVNSSPAKPVRGKPDDLLQQRLILKDTSTNTSVDLEKEILKREQAIAQRETEFLEKEKLFLTKENEFFGRENDLKAQITKLKEKLETAEDRAAKAESTVLEISSRLLQQEKDEPVVPDEPDHSIQKSQAEQEAMWNATIESLKASNQLEIEQLNAANTDLERKLALLEADTTTLTQKLREAEDRAQVSSSDLEKSENKVNAVVQEMELARKTHEAVVTQLSDEVKYHKDRVEQADKLNSQHEKQVAELKANVEAVYNRCIEKDEAIQQLKKSLSSRQDELEMLRIQHGKDSERQEKLQQQQQDLYERQLQASIIQVEMEFRKEYQQSAQKFQSFRRKSDERLKEIKRVREAYQVSLQREAAAKAEVEKLQAILADDKKKLFVEDAKRSDTFKAQIREEKAKSKQLEQRLMAEQEKYAQMALLSTELDEKKLEIEKFHEEIQNLEAQRASWKKLENDLRAALKVKDVMLADQQRQIKELADERQNSDAQFNDEMAEFQAQVEDLEAALDESLQKAAEEEVKSEKLSAKLAAVEKEVSKKEEEVSLLRSQLEQKVSALEFLDQEMQRMRTVLENQDGLFQKRMQKHLEQQQEEVERVRIAAEEERERQLHQWEAGRGEMMHKYELLATEMENVAAQNAKLREVLDQERCKTVQNDRDMRVLLAQIDRERQIKKQNLRQIRSLFEQLQRETL